MEPKIRQEVTLTLLFEIIPVWPDGQTEFLCLVCSKPLDVHQPDADLPERMLATCEDCKGWHLVEYVPDGAKAVVTALPDLAVARAAALPKTKTKTKTKTKPRGAK
jgi:hypothetical protein